MVNNKENEEDEFTVEHITEEAYMEIRERFERGVADHTDKIMKQGINQDIVMFLITSMGGYVAHYKKENNTTICYDYVIGLKINRDDYT